ncbi:MAG: ABC transporter ATP-binding protein [Lentimicrobiaceae bacterium]|nr:ABC transporter ATP-binding protein [Lentimicrobiaceae bacterium]
MNKKTLLQTNKLTIGYGNYLVQKYLELSAQDGQLICLIGTNGCGKSTLLRTLAGLQKSIHGTISIQGNNLLKLSASKRSLLLSLVLTDSIYEENMTVSDLVAMGRFPHTNWVGTLSKSDKTIISTAIEQVNLSHKAHCYLSEISDGEKQRAVIAKALTQDTPLVLLDEPTAHLDLPNRIGIMLLLRKLSVNTRKTFILSTHELDLAMQMADSIWLMTTFGVEVGLPEDLMLTQKFQQAFGNESFHFDEKDGHFSVNYLSGNLCVEISGEEIPILWASRALNRCGIKVVPSADIHIVAQKESFLFYRKNNPSKIVEVNSIENLLQAIEDSSKTAFHH